MKPLMHRVLKGVCVALFFFSQEGFSQETLADPYVVADVKIDVSGANAGEARLKAVEDAQKQALQRLLETGVLPEGAKANLARLGASDIDKLVKDIEITQEKFTTVRYMATFTVTFKEDAVQKLGALEDTDKDVSASPLPAQAEAPDEDKTAVSVPITRELESRPAVVVPVFLAKGQMLLWEEDNPWLQALAHDPKLSPLLILPTGDLSDMDALDVAGARKPTAVGLSALRQHYETPFAVVATFEEDATGATLLSFALFDEAGLVCEASQPVPTQGSLEDQLKVSIPLLTAFVQNPPKGHVVPITDAPLTGNPNELLVGVSFAGFDAWMTYKKRLESFPGVGSVTLASLTKNSASLRVIPTANKNALAKALGNAGFVVERATASPEPVKTVTPTQPTASMDDAHELR